MYPAYVSFKELRDKGLRREANTAALELVAEYRRRPEPEFALMIIEEAGGRKIHHELFRHIVYPMLRAGYDTRDPRALELLIRTIQNLYADPELHEDLGGSGEISLLNELRQLEPRNEWANTEFLRAMAAWLQFCIHEWPSGILYGNSGATADQCDEILSCVTEMRTLDAAGRYAELLETVEERTKEYKGRLS